MQDQYINHIMNETGVTVTLRGRGSGNDECMSGEGRFFIHVIWTFERNVIQHCIFYIYVVLKLSYFLVADGQQPMHLFLSSNNLKSLEDARCLAENLLDTISMECGASRYFFTL